VAPPPPTSPAVTTVEVVAAPTTGDALAAIAAYQASIPPPASPPVDDRPRLTYAMVRRMATTCYKQALKAQPDLAGRLLVEVVVDHEGRAVRARDAGSILPDPATIACIVSAMSRLEMEERLPDGTDETKITVPFTFAPPR
jgi:hypothetical protein